MENKKYIALTFDDGPNTVVTPAVLERLKKYDVVATFFVNGSNISEDSVAVMKKACEMGCEIENHSQNHLKMSELDADKIKAEIESTDKLVEKYTGRKPQFFRPPYIAVSGLMHETVDKPFICGFCPDDWDKSVTKEVTARKVIEETKDGQIILLHDSAHNMKSAQALDEIIPALKQKGFEFITVSELFKKYNITPKKGVIYSNVLQ